MIYHTTFNRMSYSNTIHKHYTTNKPQNIVKKIDITEQKVLNVLMIYLSIKCDCYFRFSVAHKNVINFAKYCRFKIPIFHQSYNLKHLTLNEMKWIEQKNERRNFPTPNVELLYRFEGVLRMWSKKSNSYTYRYCLQKAICHFTVFFCISRSHFVYRFLSDFLLLDKLWLNSFPYNNDRLYRKIYINICSTHKK